MQIKPKLSQTIQDFITSSDLFQIKDLHEGVVHIGFPDGMKANIQRFQSTFDEFGIDLNIFLAHKASKNRTFVKLAKSQDINIDVASKNELLSALDAGFIGKQIEATGPKNDEFLQLALMHQCLISLDSISELERLVAIKNENNKAIDVRVLIRLNSLEVNGRAIQIKQSRFGINPKQIPQMFQLLKEHNIDLLGFHFHADGYDFTMRAGFLETMFELIKDSYQQGFTPSVINIGGAFRDQTLENYLDWSEYINQIEQDMINQKPLPTWANQTFGLSINQHGRIAGKEKAMSLFYKNSIEQDIRTLMSQKSSNNRDLCDMITENMLTLSIEPGYAMLQQSGISLVKVIETKQASDGRNMVVVDANLYNLGLAKLYKYYTDPLHIPHNKNCKKANSNFTAFVVGNLCREDDILIDRLIEFDTQPKPGDLLVFTNTAAYFAGFEDASPIMHPLAKFFTAYKSKQGDWQLTTPDQYNPSE